MPAAGVTVVIGCGLHATTSEAERGALVGPGVAARVRVEDAQGLDDALRRPRRDLARRPRAVARRVAEADLAVTVGVVEPHLYAGFSGGVKGVAIGCAGHETIAWTHRPAFISEPGRDPLPARRQPLPADAARDRRAHAPALGRQRRDDGGRRRRGDGRRRSRGRPGVAGREIGAGAWLRAVDGPFDVVVAGVHAPKSDNLYQASRAATYVGLAARPALADGGLLVLCADLPDGAGTGPGEQNFARVLAAAGSPAELVARGLREPLGPGGQRAFVVARVLAALPRRRRGRGRPRLSRAARSGRVRLRRRGRREPPRPASAAAPACSPSPTPWRRWSRPLTRGRRPSDRPSSKPDTIGAP